MAYVFEPEVLSAVAQAASGPLGSENEPLDSALNDHFGAFDDIIARHKVEKLKTIGDAYMCADGLPEANRTHPLDVCLAALEIQNFMRRRHRGRQAQNLPVWELRVGLHTGPVMAGVIGKSKFAYSDNAPKSGEAVH